MRWILLLVFIGGLLMKNVAPSKDKRHPSTLEWLFGLNNKLHEKEEHKEENKPTVCQSQECKKIARMISGSMDTSVDPCDDFYEYACGKWSEQNPIPKGSNSWTMFESVQRNVLKQIKEIFDEGPKADDLLAVKLAKKWYAVCMDTDTMDRQGLEPLVFTLSRIGGWPMIMEPDEWNEQEYSWQKVDDQYVRLTGRNVFHDVRVVEYGVNESQKFVHIATPHLPPGSYRLWSSVDESEEEEDASDQDLSDEEKQSEPDSQEPGSKEDVETDDNSDNKDVESNDDAKENDNNKEQDNENEKKKVSVKKSSKLAKKKKLGHGEKIKHSASKKNKNHNTKKERVKRRAILTHIREKLRVQKDKRNHAKRTHREKLKKSRVEVTTQSSTEETIDEEEDDEIKEYTDYISKVARAIGRARGIEISEKHMQKDIEDMIDFQVKLVEIITNDDDDEKKLTLNDFQEWYDKKKPKTSNSAIDWLYKIGELFDEAHVPVGGDLEVEISSLDYFECLVSLLDKTSSRTIVNYIHWNFLSRIIRATTSEMRKLYNEWQGVKDNEEHFEGIPQRTLQCTEASEMRDIVAYEYVRKHFSDDIMTTASDMIDDIQKEVEYQIKESEWMDEDTQDFVLAKLVKMDKFIGYPDWYRNNTIVKRYFQGLIIGHSYYENILSYDRYSKWKRLRILMKEDEDDETMGMSPLMVNAFFSPDDNFIAVSAADFQSPLFAYGRPQAINYGIIGTIMGHEVNHGFDDSGHLYDKNGEIVEWLSTMAEAYGKRAGCFVNQFNNYVIDKTSNYKIKNYGNQTAGENIADTMGLEASFRAYQRRERQCGKQNTVLPALEDFTSDQLFFLSYAYLWCDASDTNDTISSAKSDEHSVSRLRVIGSLSNSEDFAKAYNCPINSAMNPEKKCHIWK